jgi:hypothetical protein
MISAKEPIGLDHIILVDSRHVETVVMLEKR